MTWHGTGLGRSEVERLQSTTERITQQDPLRPIQHPANMQQFRWVYTRLVVAQGHALRCFAVVLTPTARVSHNVSNQLLEEHGRVQRMPQHLQTHSANLWAGLPNCRPVDATAQSRRS